MNSRRRFESIFVALLFVAISTGLLVAQEQQGAYPPPIPSAQQSYPDQAGQQYPQQQQPYPGQQPYPQAGQGYPQGQPAQQQQDPPGRVARVQYMSGQVSMQPGGVNDWIAATMNRPLTTSDRVWTDKNSKAELNVGDGFLRMNSETSVTLRNVTDQNVQIELDQGTLEVTVKHLAKGEIYEIDTPNYAFTVMKSGLYRFDVYPNEDQSWVTVRSGYGEATGKASAVRVNSGQQVRFSGGQSLVHTAENAPARDGFDDWVQVRDKRLDDSLSARYVSPGVIGYQDLDGYGRWVPTPSYGNVWIPYSVPTGWAPYRFGHWTWIAPWGWTWVDDAPWGFAPFHYGRWVSWGGGWAWAPGPLGYWNPYYAPALVGWIGGPGFGIGFGWGGGFGIGVNFGWFPLGWGEPFYPRYCGWGYGGWYRGGGWASANYIRNVNITNTRITNINNVTNNYYRGNVGSTNYAFRNTAGAVTAAPKTAFTSGAAINKVGGAVPKSALGQGSLLRGVNATPTRQSITGGVAQAHNTPPASAFNRPVMTANGRSNTSAMRPANLQAANQATEAHGNMNSFNGRGSSTAEAAAGNATRSTFDAQNTHSTTTGNTAAGNATHPTFGAQNSRPSTQASTAAHRPTTNGTEARLDSTPTSMGGHYVPRPPSAGGMATSRSGATGAASGNSAYGHTNGAANSNYANSHQPTMNGSQQHGAATNSTTPHSTQPYSSGHTNAAPQSSPSHGSSAPHSSSGSSSGSHGSASVARPPANYSYHAAPTYSASANYGAAGRGYGSGYYGNSRGYTSQAYSGSRSYGSYGSSSGYSAQRSYRSSPAYSGRSYGSSPTYSARNYGSSPSYSSRSYGASPSSSSRSYGSSGSHSYSAPHYSGGGGGGYHGGGGGGSHGGGGGHR